MWDEKARGINEAVFAKIGDIKRNTASSSIGSDAICSKISSIVSTAASSLQGSLMSISDRISSYMPYLADLYGNENSHLETGSGISSNASYIQFAKTSINSVLNHPSSTDTEYTARTKLEIFQRQRSRSVDIIRNFRSESFKKYAHDRKAVNDRINALPASLVDRNRRHSNFNTEVLSNGLLMNHQMLERLRAHVQSFRQCLTSREEIPSVIPFIGTRNVGNSNTELAEKDMQLSRMSLNKATECRMPLLSPDLQKPKAILADDIPAISKLLRKTASEKEAAVAAEKKMQELLEETSHFIKMTFEHHIVYKKLEMHVESLKVPINVSNAPTTYILKIDVISCGNKTETFSFESKGCHLVMFDQTVYLKNINIHNIQSLQVKIKVSMNKKRLCFLKKKILVGKACVQFEDKRVSSRMHVTKVLSRKKN
ncbi:hypothetical protein DPMN_103921 [Dreissena polymorpha]|uniref:Uncharacterized protein n=1 Tax=Dreissena polymorpha TaxID=45954 RepID=A0A9D4JZL6_DREPO|nr:hypothetical protein DPMN_103921 [Dreissena polymorpha]